MIYEFDKKPYLESKKKPTELTRHNFIKYVQHYRGGAA